MIEISEYSTGTADLAPLPFDEQERMRLTLGSRLSVSWLSDDRVEVRATSFVGSIDLTPNLRVRVVPKLAGGDLGVLTMLAVTNGCIPHDLPRYFRGLSPDPEEDAVQLLCKLVVMHVEGLVTRGLVRDYRGHSDDLPFLRGRLDVYRQATVYFGKFNALACAFDEFDHDTIENHLLLAGVQIARRVAVDARLRRRAAELEDRLKQIAPTLPPTKDLLMTPIVYGRRTEPYRAAHTWCRCLLELTRVSDTIESSLSVDAFLIDMNRLYERFIEWLVDQVIAGSGIDMQSQKRNPSLITVNGESRRSIAPDLVLRRGEHQCAIDSKYKRYDSKTISNEDIYQLLLYAQCYTGFTHIPTSYLLFPASDTSIVEMTVELTVPGEGADRRVRIKAVGIPLQNIVRGLLRGTHSMVQSLCGLRLVGRGPL